MDLCIYHDNCNDGFAAALAVWLKYGDIEFHPASYEQDPPDVTGKDVIIVDFSYPRIVLQQMHRDARSLLVIDHHKTARQDLEGLNYCIFDEEKCGAVLTWEHLFPNKDTPLLFLYIQDRDLWLWEMELTGAVYAWLKTLGKDFEKWENLLEPTTLAVACEAGQAIVRYQDTCIKQALDQPIGQIHLAGYIVPCINTTHLISEIVGKLAELEDVPFAVGWFETGTHRIYSLRSRKGGVDVSRIAQKYGGGGHPGAAGFTEEVVEYKIIKKAWDDK